MKPQEQKKYILDAIDMRLHEVKAQWAKNYIAMRINENIVLTDTNEKSKRDTASKQVEACKTNMKIAEQEIDNFAWLLKQEK